MGSPAKESTPAPPAAVAIMGSGEISATGRRVYNRLLGGSPQPVRISILETPAGFQPNSTQVALKVGDFLRRSLQNYQPHVTIVPARRRDGPYSTEDQSIVSPVLPSDMIFMGPGSPTYAVRHLQNSLAWHTVQACHRQGAILVLASSAAIAAGIQALPVYEIYKAGADLHWCDGLDLFGPYGLSLVFVSHWNNREGGAELDTSRCYMGQSRFDRLLAMLPVDATIVGIDEHTALLVELATETCRVMGRGAVTLLRKGQEDEFADGETFALNELGSFRRIEPQSDIPPEIWQRVRETRSDARPAPGPQPPADVLALVEAREKARARGDWQAADALREQILVSGWTVNDTPDGPELAQS